MQINNIYISTTFIDDGESLYKVLDICNENDINSIEIGSNHCYEEHYDYISNYNFNWIVHNYFPIPKDSFVLNIASSNDKIYEKSIKHIKNAIDFCEKINAKLYTFHPGFITDPVGPNLSKNNYDFQWNNQKLINKDYSFAYDRMLRALEVSINYAKKKKIKIAIETEGSFMKKDHLLMQQPLEFTKFMSEFDPADIGINLNIGHLLLASRAFNFDISDFVDGIERYIVAMELSHNDGVEDQHLPLKKNEWYWSLIFDERFVRAFKILEFRNTSIQTIKNNIKLYNQMHNGS